MEQNMKKRKKTERYVRVKGSSPKGKKTKYVSSRLISDGNTQHGIVNGFNWEGVYGKRSGSWNVEKNKAAL